MSSSVCFHEGVCHATCVATCWILPPPRSGRYGRQKRYFQTQHLLSAASACADMHDLNMSSSTEHCLWLIQILLKMRVTDQVTDWNHE